MSSDDEQQHLHERLVKLGDMMGDGLHLEPDGKWISAEYRQVLRALGYLPDRAKRREIINERMKTRTQDVTCRHCYGKLKQTRSGSKRACCVECGRKYQLLK